MKPVILRYNKNTMVFYQRGKLQAYMTAPRRGCDELHLNYSRQKEKWLVQQEQAAVTKAARNIDWLTNTGFILLVMTSP